jgi:hypothetical protein
MTPKEKANELLDKYWLLDIITTPLTKHQAKQCALIAVDEIINNINPIEIVQLTSAFKTSKDFDDNLVFIDNYITKNLINEKLHWQEVKQEINKL